MRQVEIIIRYSDPGRPEEIEIVDECDIETVKREVASAGLTCRIGGLVSWQRQLAAMEDSYVD